MPISVVIPNYNGAHLLQKHLPAVLRECSPKDEVVVVDDASTDSSLAVLKDLFPTVKVVSLKENKRFAHACNIGVSHASNSLVILLNSDVAPRSGAFKVLEEALKDSSLFAVGCKEFAGSEVSGRSCARIERGLFLHAKHPTQITGHSAWSSGGSMAFRKEVWLELGGMDSLFRPAYYEDIDLCYRAWQKGWRVVFDDRARIDHVHESTNKAAFGAWKIRVMAQKNAFLFFWKNIRDLRFWRNHLFWLGYHLSLGSLRSRGVVLIGFLAALLQVPELLRSAKRVKHPVRSDAEIMELIRC